MRCKIATKMSTPRQTTDHRGVTQRRFRVIIGKSAGRSTSNSLPRGAGILPAPALHSNPHPVERLKVMPRTE